MRQLLFMSIVLAIVVATLLWLTRKSGVLETTVPSVSSTNTTTPLATQLSIDEPRAQTVERAKVDATTSPTSNVATKTSGPRAHIFGRVVDERGIAVPDSQVRISPRTGRWSRHEPLDSTKLPSDKSESATTTTDAGGRFSFDVPAPTTSSVSVEVTPPGFLRRVEFSCAQGWDGDEIRVGENDLGDILVEPGSALTGRVVDESNRAIEKASLSVERAPGDDRTRHTFTDADGLFTIEHLTPGPRILSASAPDKRPSEKIAVELTVGKTHQLEQIVLSRCSSISGLVVDATGAPAEGVLIRAQPTSGSTRSFGKSNALGAFQIALNVDVSHTLSILRSDQWAGVLDESTLTTAFEPGRTDIRLLVKAARRISFRVVKVETGEPIEHFGIALRRKIPAGTFTTESELDIEEHAGGLALLATEPGAMRLVVEAPGRSPFEGEVALDAGSDDTQTIHMGPEAVLVGRIFVGHQPAPGARVQLMRETWRADGELTIHPRASDSNGRTDVDSYAGRDRAETADGDGRFRFQSLPTGTFALVASARGGASMLEREIGVFVTRTTDLGELHLQTAGTVRGVFIPPPEVSPIGYRIILDPVGDDPRALLMFNQRTVLTKRIDGRFEFDDVPEGTYQAQWSRPDKLGSYMSMPGPSLPRVVVKSGEVSELVLDASATSDCIVAVTVSKSALPFVDVVVRAMVRGRGESQSWSSVDLGSTDANGITEGKIEGGREFRLMVYAPGGIRVLVESSEVLVSVPRGRIEREIKLETGSVVLVMPADLEPPANGEIQVALTNAEGKARYIHAVRSSQRLRVDQIAWKDSVVDLGPVAAGKYSMRVLVQRLESDPKQPLSFVRVPLRSEFETNIDVRSNEETRVEVR